MIEILNRTPVPVLPPLEVNNFFLYLPTEKIQYYELRGLTRISLFIQFSYLEKIKGIIPQYTSLLRLNLTIPELYPNSNKIKALQSQLIKLFHPWDTQYQRNRIIFKREEFFQVTDQKSIRPIDTIIPDYNPEYPIFLTKLYKEIYLLLPTNNIQDHPDIQKLVTKNYEASLKKIIKYTLNNPLNNLLELNDLSVDLKYIP